MGSTKSSLGLSDVQIDTSSIPNLDDQYGPHFVTETRPCATWWYNDSSSEWTCDDDSKEIVHKISASFTCVSYNIWFAQSFQKERATALANLLESLEPSIICLVEVRTEPLTILLSLAWARKNYYFSSIYLPIGGALIMTHRGVLPRPTFTHHTWPTNMPRIFLRARFTTSDTKNDLAVGCVHLESMSSQAMREGQLRVCSQVLRSSSHALLMGDFNISEKKEENCAIERMLPQFVDVWRLIHKRSPGYTRDTVKNTMLNAKVPKKFRIDRIMCKRGNAELALVPQAIKILGDTKFATFPDEESTRDLFISDHFGLFAGFSFFASPSKS